MKIAYVSNFLGGRTPEVGKDWLLTLIQHETLLYGKAYVNIFYGKSMSFWFKKRLGNFTLRDHAINTINNTLLGAIVSDMWSNHSWKSKILQRYLPF